MSHRIAIQTNVDKDTYDRVVYPAKMNRKLGVLVADLLKAYGNNPVVRNAIDIDNETEEVITNHVINQLFDNLEEVDKHVSRVKEYSESLSSSMDTVQNEIKKDLESEVSLETSVEDTHVIETSSYISDSMHMDDDDEGLDIEILEDSLSESVSIDGEDALASLMNGNTFNF